MIKKKEIENIEEVKTIDEVGVPTEFETIEEHEEIFEIAKKRYIATVPLKIDGVEIEIGEEIKDFEGLRKRTQKALLNLRRVKVVI